MAEKGNRNKRRNNVTDDVTDDDGLRGGPMRALVGTVVERPEGDGARWSGPEEPGPDTLHSRARAKPWSFFPSWQPIFLERLAQVPNVAGAARAAGIARRTAYTARKSDPAFAEAWEEAIEASVDDLIERAWKRAETESDRLMEVMLKAHRPAMFGDKARVELSGPEGGPIQHATGTSDHEREMLRAAIDREYELRGLKPPD